MDASPRARLAWAAAALAAALDGALALAWTAAGDGRVAFVDPALSPPAWPTPSVGPEDAVLARLTADDVARGVWALAEGPDGPPLTAEQRGRLAEVLSPALATRAKVGALRGERRARALALADEAGALAVTPEIVAAARTTPAPAPPGGRTGRSP